jgi:DNA-binding CsgD family transcriptional regulator
MALIPGSGRGGERRTTLDLLEALGSALDIRVVLERAYPFLLRLVPADYGALGISSSGRPEDYEWIVAKLPPAFFTAYPEMAPHDFVRASVARQPNRVLRDQEMVSRPALETNMMYRRARELGVPLEQVMAVMLHVDDRWQSGLSLYRDRRRPFTARERAVLQDVTPAIMNAVRSCHLFGAATHRLAAVETLLPDWDASRLVVVPPDTVLEETDAAARLIEKWFDRHERPAGRLPVPLATVLARGAATIWTRRDAESTLAVSFVPPSVRTGPARWLLLLRETCHTLQIPPLWRALLTPRQQEVTEAVLRGWDNRLIAGELGCATATVKRHLQTIFDALGVQSRASLIASAAAQRRGD